MGAGILVKLFLSSFASVRTEGRIESVWYVLYVTYTRR